jgi:hypothetical protein
VLRKKRNFIGCILGILTIRAMLLLFILTGALSSTDGPPGGYEKTVFYFETSNAEIAKFITATAFAKTQAAGK